MPSALRLRKVVGRLNRRQRIEITNNIETHPLFIVKEGVGNEFGGKYDGACYKGLVWGTYIHGIFHNYIIRRNFLNYIRSKKGLKLDTKGIDPYEDSLDQSIEQLAKLIEDNVNMDYIDKLIFGDEIQQFYLIIKNQKFLKTDKFRTKIFIKIFDYIS